MKTKLILLSAIVAVGTSLAIAAAAAPSVIAAKRRKRYAGDTDDFDEEDGSRTYYEVPDSNDAEAMEGSVIDDLEMGSGAIRTPDSICLETLGAGRKIILRPNGALEFYEDDVQVGKKMVEAWPEGDFKIYAVYLHGLYWLFFEKFHTGCFANIDMKAGFYKMDYAMALDSSFAPLSLSLPKTIAEEKSHKSFSIAANSEQVCIAKKVMLHVPDHIRVGDTDRTIEDFTYFGSEDDVVYVCRIEEVKAYPYLYVKEGYEVDLVDNYAIVDLKDCYMVYRWISSNKISTQYFKDCFGKHDFARFKRACEEYEVKLPFYENAEPPKDTVIL